jgi:hypothetical protein
MLSACALDLPEEPEEELAEETTQLQRATLPSDSPAVAGDVELTEESVDDPAERTDDEAGRLPAVAGEAEPNVLESSAGHRCRVHSFIGCLQCPNGCRWIGFTDTGHCVGD